MVTGIRKNQKDLNNKGFGLGTALINKEKQPNAISERHVIK